MNTRSISQFLGVVLGVSILGLLGNSAFAGSQKSIGRITHLDKKYWGMRLAGGGGDRDAAVNGKIYEKDVVQTIAHQHLSIMLEDGTELVIGPSSRLIFKNWTGRDSDGRRERTLFLQTGMLKAKVRKIYSQDEPFIVENRNGVIAVRGTEFVTEAGSGGRLGRIGQTTAGEKLTRNSEVELHTLEGEVHFARTKEGLKNAESRVSVTAGQTSLVRANMTVPQQPHTFNLQKFTTYIAKATPGVQLNVVKNTDNSKRAETASNSKRTNSVSPAQPTYAKTDLKKDASRSIASVSPGSELTRAVSNKSHERREELGVDKPTKGQKDALAGDSRTHKPLTTDGVHRALSGNEVQQALASHHSSGRSQGEAPGIQDSKRHDPRLLGGNGGSVGPGGKGHGGGNRPILQPAPSSAPRNPLLRRPPGRAGTGAR